MRVFIAVPGLDGYQAEADLDTSKCIDDMYYKGKGIGKDTASLTPCAYVYRLEGKQEISELIAKQNREKSELDTKHYQELSVMRAKWGI